MKNKFFQTFEKSFIQLFDDTGQGRKNMVRIFPMKEFDKNKDLVVSLNEAGAGVFFTPNPCKNGRKEEDVERIQWVYVDMDNGTKDEMKALIKSSPLTPDIVIESKRSYHLYWKADYTKEQFKQITEGLIWFFNGDKAISSINEVLRMPDFLHMKDPNDPFLVKIIYFCIHNYTAEKMLTSFKIQKGNIMDRIKDIPLHDVLHALGVERRGNFIVENGEITSASINVKDNYINRFSGRDGSGSTIDACIHYGKMSLPQAVNYLKTMAGINDIDEIMKQKRKNDPLAKRGRIFTWGTDNLDRMVTPISEDSFVILAGESGSGKTAWSFDTAYKNAQLGHKVLYLTLEMNTDSILNRISREFAKINKEQWRDKSLISDDQRLLFGRKKKELVNNENLIPIGFQSGVQPTLRNIEGTIKKVQPNLVFIDNLDLIEKEHGVSSYDAENKISKKLLDLAKSLPMPIILIHHLKKGSDDDLKKPRGLNSVRGSGKIVHNADMVLMGYRHPYKENMTDEEKASFTVIQLKDREFGIGGMCKIYFSGGSFFDQLPEKYFNEVFYNQDSVCQEN